MESHDAEFANLIARAITQADPSIESRLDDDPQAHVDLVVMTHRAGEVVGDLLRNAVASARAAGASWETIGQALGMSRQAAQQRFGAPRQPEPGTAEHRQLVGLSAFNEMEELEAWGRHGWHSVRYGPLFHDVEASDVQWEHARAVAGSRKAKELDAEGWERIGTLWFPFMYFKRALDVPALPGEPT